MTHCWIIFQDDGCMIVFRTLDKMHCPTTRHKIKGTGVGKLCNIFQSQDPIFPFPNQEIMSHRPFGSTLKSQAGLSLSLVIDYTTWSVMLTQVQQEVLAMMQIPPKPVGRKSRPMWLFITTLVSEFKLICCASKAEIISFIYFFMGYREISNHLFKLCNSHSGYIMTLRAHIKRELIDDFP